ncbi:MAG: DUF3592 domain-containing protein [Oscillospiraceae bacterium]|nr:DUF3592 domain-containing protein [Oscillospiraceae bacterium]
MDDVKRRRAGIAMIVLGAFFVIGLFSDIGRWKIWSTDPVTVQATVTGNDESYNYRGSKSHGNMYTYVPHVTYEVHGTVYHDVRVYDDTPRHSPAPVGSTITLTVDGKHPQKILKSPGVMAYVFGALSFFCIAIGILIVRGKGMDV